MITRQSGIVLITLVVLVSVTSAGPCLAASLIQGDTWFPIGPAPILGFYTPNSNYSGRATAIAVNPHNVDDVWLGTAGGGVWHSTDGGNTWRPMSDNPAPDKRRSLAVGALEPDRCDALGLLPGVSGAGG